MEQAEAPSKSLTIKPTREFLSFHPESERRPPLCHKLFFNASLYQLLLAFDEDLAAETKRGRCQQCGGRLDDCKYPRKPRVAQTMTLPKGYDWRFSYACATRTCRKRQTPPSTRFLGRRVYLGAVVVLATALQQGVTPWRASHLHELLGVSTRTLARWRTWWAEAFTESTFWKAAKAAFAPAVHAAEAPSSLLARFTGDERERLAGLMRFLAPLSTPDQYVPDRRW